MKNGLYEIENIFKVLKLYEIFSHDRNGITYAFFFITDSKLGTIKERIDTIDFCVPESSAI
jgi:hypothetical protein